MISGSAYLVEGLSGHSIGRPYVIFSLICFILYRLQGKLGYPTPPPPPESRPLLRWVRIILESILVLMSF